MICSKAFQVGERGFYGFDAKAEELCTCDQCQSHITTFVTQNAVRVLKPYKEPAPTGTLWRYLDLAKFISLLEESALYFCRGDNFLNDPFEGATGFKSMQPFWEQKEREGLIESIKGSSQRGYIQQGMDEAAIIELADKSRAAIREFRGKFKPTRIFITCWHLNPVESEAMWQIYSRRNEYMVVIKTTAERLDKALGEHSDNEIGEVNYVDYKHFYAPPDYPFWYKRQSFEHEHEVRAVIDTLHITVDAKGIFEPVNLEVLIEKIVIAPKSPDWFEDLVRSITLRYNKKFEILRSEMDAEPFF
jgi:hypothetical protein